MIIFGFSLVISVLRHNGLTEHLIMNKESQTSRWVASHHHFTHYIRPHGGLYYNISAQTQTAFQCDAAQLVCNPAILTMQECLQFS